MLAGDGIAESETAEYLGVIIEDGGITDKKTILRIGKAISRQRLMKSLGMYHGGYNTERCLKLHKAFIRPLREYAIHLSPMSVKVRHKLYELRQELMEKIFGKWARHTRRDPAIYVTWSRVNTAEFYVMQKPQTD